LSRLTIPLSSSGGQQGPALDQQTAALRPLLVGIRELCGLLSRSRASLARDDAAGRLVPAIWINGSKRWRYADVVLWCEMGCPPAAEFQARKEAAERRTR
jgi:hypothetical protein